MIFSKTAQLDQVVPSQSYQNLATLLCFYGLGLCTAAWAPLIPYAQQRLHLNHAEFGGLLLCGGLGSMIAMPATGLIIQKLGCRSVIAVLLVLLFMTLPVLSLVQTSHMMAIGLFIFGSAAGGLGVAINLQAVIVEKNLSLNMMSSFHGMCSLGGLSGVMLMTLLLAFGLSPVTCAFLVSGLMLTLALIAVPHSLSKQETGDQSVDAEEKTKAWMMPKPLILMFGLMCFIAFLTEGSAMDWSGIYLINQFKIDTAFAGLAYTFFAIAMTIGRFSGQYLQRVVGEYKVVFYGAVLATTGLVLVILAPNWSLAVLGYLLMGFGCSNIVPIIFSQVGRQTVMPKAKALSYVSTMAYSGVLVGPALIGLGSELIGLTMVFTIIVIAILTLPILNKLTRSKLS